MTSFYKMNYFLHSFETPTLGPTICCFPNNLVLQNKTFFTWFRDTYPGTYHMSFSKQPCFTKRTIFYMVLRYLSWDLPYVVFQMTSFYKKNHFYIVLRHLSRDLPYVVFQMTSFYKKNHFLHGFKTLTLRPTICCFTNTLVLQNEQFFTWFQDTYPGTSNDAFPGFSFIFLV